MSVFKQGPSEKFCGEISKREPATLAPSALAFGEEATDRLRLQSFSFQGLVLITDLPIL